IDHAEEAALHLVEEGGQRGGIDAWRGHVGTQPVGGQEPQRHQHPALQLRDLGDVLEALEPFHHALGPSAAAAISSTLPPATSTFGGADSLPGCALTVRACATAPSPSPFTAARSARLMRPASTSLSGSTTLPAANRSDRSFTLTTAYSVFPPYGRKPRLGGRR